MSTRTILVLFLAITFGACAAIGVGRLRTISNNGEVQELQPVVTVAADVSSGQELGAKNLKLSHYRPQDIPKGALTSLEDATGRTALVMLYAGEPIIGGKVTAKGAGSGLAVMVPDGMRAFTIQTPHLSGEVGGFLKPGYRVDVLLTSSQSGTDNASQGFVTTTLLQNIQVLAVAQKLEPGDDYKKAEEKDKKAEPDETKSIANIRSVSLLVTPDQAAKLALGMNRGLLHLSLRNPADHREARASLATTQDLRYYSEGPLALLNLARQLAVPPVTMVAAPAPPPPAKLVEKPKEEKKPEKVESRFTEIRTLRGLDAGAVRVELPRGATRP
jgi:pilus assembly protein CpaB